MFCSFMGRFLQDLEMSWHKRICAICNILYALASYANWFSVCSNLFMPRVKIRHVKVLQGTTTSCCPIPPDDPSIVILQGSEGSEYKTPGRSINLNWQHFSNFKMFCIKTVKNHQKWRQPTDPHNRRWLLLTSGFFWHQNTIIYSGP